MSVPTFIVGTGRCGSTMLSNMLREHPKVLSLSEFFIIVTDAGRYPGAFGSDELDGREFWSMLAWLHPRNAFALRHGVAPPEIIYPFDDPKARFSREVGVPSVLLVTLPHLDADADGLFDVLHDEVSGWSAAPPGEQYRRLFGWLCERFGKRLWVERSGSSLVIVPQLLATFPDARFVHVSRDPRDAAISMQQHSGFRLGLLIHMLTQALGVDPLASTNRTHVDRVPAYLRPFLPEQFDVDAFRTFRIPLEHIGAMMLSGQLEVGLEPLAALPADRVHHLRYEDFFADPKQQLDRLVNFLGKELIDEEWSNHCIARLRRPRSSWRDLPHDEARALTDACRPAFERLAAAGVAYEA